jgi:acyl-coenzyme A thioesterase PaaI-like protein
VSGNGEADSEETAPRPQLAAAFRDLDAYEGLVGATRAYLRTLRLSDPPTDVLARAASLVQQATALLAAHPGDADRLHGATGPFVPTTGSRKPAGETLDWHFSFSPVVGPLCPQSPPIEMTFDGERIRGRAVVDARFGGPPHTVHGGVVALIFDELLGNTNYCLGMGAMTGTLSVRYERPTPLDRELELAGWLDRVEGRKIFTRGTISSDGAVTASAEGVFVRVSRADVLPTIAPATRASGGGSGSAG